MSGAEAGAAPAGWGLSALRGNLCGGGGRGAEGQSRDALRNNGTAEKSARKKKQVDKSTCESRLLLPQGILHRWDAAHGSGIPHLGFLAPLVPISCYLCVLYPR